MPQGQGTYDGKSRAVEAMTGYVTQGQGTYEGKSREVKVMTGYVWDKARTHTNARAGKWRQWQDAFGTRAGYI